MILPSQISFDTRPRKARALLQLHHGRDYTTHDGKYREDGQRQEDDELSAQNVTELGEYDEKSWSVSDNGKKR